MTTETNQKYFSKGLNIFELKIEESLFVFWRMNILFNSGASREAQPDDAIIVEIDNIATKMIIRWSSWIFQLDLSLEKMNPLLDGLATATSA